MRWLAIAGVMLTVSWSVAQAAETWGCVYQGEDGLYWVNEHAPPVRFLPLTSPGAVHAAISPDGRRVGLVTGGGSFMVHDTVTGKTSLVCQGGGIGAMTWSPDSRTLAYVWKSGLRIVKPGGQIGLLATIPNMTDMGWSPDGQWLAFGRTKSSKGGCCEDDGLWLISVRGGQPRRLTPGIGDLYVAQDPHWSPDGKWIAFVHGYEGAMLAFVRPDGSGYRKQVDRVSWIQWRPDGSAVIYKAMEDEATTRGLAECTPTGKPRLLRRASDNIQLLPLPGRDLLVLDQGASGVEALQIKRVTVRPEGDQLQWFHALPASCAVQPSPDGRRVALRLCSGSQQDAVYFIDGAGEPTAVARHAKALLGWMRPEASQ